MRLFASVIVVVSLALPSPCATSPASAAPEANISGRWSGSFDITLPDGTVKNDSALLNLNQNGETLTGTAGPDENKQMPISDGKIGAQQFQFKVEQGSDMNLRFDLHLEGGHLKGEAVGNMPEGKVKVEVDVVRADSEHSRN